MTRAVLCRERVIPVDPATCRSLGAAVIADDASVWVRDERVDLDPATTRRMGAYLWDAARVYLLDEYGPAIEIDADGASFEAFAAHLYARDARGVVFGNQRVDLPGSALTDREHRRARAFDAVLILDDAVFVDGIRHEADPDTVAWLGEGSGTLSDGFWHDEAHLYFRARQVAAIDGELAVLGDRFARIGSRLYFEDVELG